MANITQTIHALTQGISQQPDEQKIPGQVKDMVNAIPNITEGLLKRPAGKFVRSLSDNLPTGMDSSATGKWFHYYRDENEQYIGQIDRDGTVKMYDCLTGTPKTVVVANPTTSRSATYTRTGYEITITLANHGFLVGKCVDLDFTSGGATDNVYQIIEVVNANTFKVQDTTDGPISTSNVTVKDNYLMHTDEEDLQTLTLNDFTYINNRKVITEMDTTIEDDTNFKKEMYVELKTISYSKQYALNLFNNTTTETLTTATRINVELIKSSNNSCQSDGSFPANRAARISQTTRCDDSAGDSRDAFAPNVATRIFDITDGAQLTDVAISSTETYNIDVKDANGNSVNRGKNLYFRITTTGQSVPYTSGTNTTYQARYTTSFDLLHGGEGWLAGDYFYVWMKDGYYKVTVETISTAQVQANLALARPQPTPFDTKTTITAESILGDIRTEIIADGNIAASDIEIIGNGLYIKHSTNFNGSTPVGELLNVVACQVKDIGDLPTQCKHGMVVEVINSTAQEDNYYVKFYGNNDKDGEGIWEECAKPGRKIRLKRSTMPVALIRTEDGNFRLTELDGSTYNIGGVQQPDVPKWDDALVGDEDTNPEPSFIGQSVNKMLFFRNRFAILSDENIILSRAGDFTNFFAKSAIQLIASDPIDIAASSTYPTILFDGIQVNTGLVLFSKNQQFMLTTDSDTFGPLTAKINALSTYNFNSTTNPVSLGTTIGFLDNAGKFSRFWEMTRIAREGEPQVLEQSAVVSRLFAKNLKYISNSRENSVIFFSEKGNNNLYGFRYFDQVFDRKLASWFRWELTGNIQYHCMQDDSLFVVVRNNNKNQLLRYSIKLEDTSATISSNDYRVHLDHLMSVTTQTSDYDAAENKTYFTKPVGLESNNQLVAYDTDAGTDLGRYSVVTINGSTLEIDGNWGGQTFLLGYNYTMKLQLPTIYYHTKDGEKFIHDTRANTIIHRVKVGFGPIGLYRAVVKKVGRPTDYDETFEVTQSDTYATNATAIVDDNNLRVIPIYERNINADITLESTHPSPATIHNFTWEGTYTNNYYERV